MRPLGLTLIVTAALALASTATAAPPVPRIAYGKAVAYLTAQAKAHKTKISCEKWNSNGLIAKYECVFGTTRAVRITYGGDCKIMVGLYGGARTDYGFLDRIGDRREVQLCRNGWQKELPTPWSS